MKPNQSAKKMIIKAPIFFKVLNWITRSDFNGITLYPFIFINPHAISEDQIKILINHEKIHIAQYRELWIIGFYFLYLYYWIRNLIMFFSIRNLTPKNASYYMIPFEIEAYSFEENKDYLETRKPFSWKKYANLHKNFLEGYKTD